MFAFLTVVLELLGVMAKNPLFQKIAIFTFFFGLVSYTVDFFTAKVTTNFGDISQILVLASYLGFLNALKVVFNFLITGFIAKQILAFIRTWKDKNMITIKDIGLEAIIITKTPSKKFIQEFSIRNNKVVVKEFPIKADGSISNHTFKVYPLDCVIGIGRTLF